MTIEQTIKTADTVAEASPPYAEDGLNDDGLDHEGECPICAAHRDPVTGNPRYRPEVYEGMREVDDMLSGKIPSTLRSFNSLEEMLEDLDRDDVVFYRTGSHSDLY